MLDKAMFGVVKRAPVTILVKNGCNVNPNIHCCLPWPSVPPIIWAKYCSSEAKSGLKDDVIEVTGDKDSTNTEEIITESNTVD